MHGICRCNVNFYFSWSPSIILVFLPLVWSPKAFSHSKSLSSKAKHTSRSDEWLFLSHFLDVRTCFLTFFLVHLAPSSRVKKRRRTAISGPRFRNHFDLTIEPGLVGDGVKASITTLTGICRSHHIRRSIHLIKQYRPVWNSKRRYMHVSRLRLSTRL
jgi:hypothetical protein